MDTLATLEANGFRFLGYVDAERVFLDVRTSRNVMESEAVERLRARTAARFGRGRGRDEQ